MFEWAWPWLFVLAPLPWLAARLLPPARESGGAALRLPYVGISTPVDSGAVSTPRGRRWLACAVWALLLAAAARPQHIGEPIDLPRSGRDLLLAVDTSGSMSTQDMAFGGQALDRFSAIQAIAGDFIERRAGDRIGLILFGSRAYLLTPLTFDHRSVRAQLDESAIGLAGRETAIGDAVGLAVKRLRERPENQRVLVLLTDGVNNAGELEPSQATELAVANHVRIYAIGIGAEAMRVDSFFGSRIVNPSADLDEHMLTDMAQQTGGRYFRARDAGELAKIYRAIDQLEPVAGTSAQYRPVDEWFHWPLAAALLLGLLMALLPWWQARSTREVVST